MGEDDVAEMPLLYGEVVCEECHLAFLKAVGECTNCAFWGPPWAGPPWVNRR